MASEIKRQASLGFLNSSIRYRLNEVPFPIVISPFYNFAAILLIIMPNEKPMISVYYKRWQEKG